MLCRNFPRIMSARGVTATVDRKLLSEQSPARPMESDMKTTSQRVLVTLTGLALLPAAFLAAGGCSSTEGVEQQEVYQAPGAVAVVDTFTTVATVTAIDATRRKVTMTTPDGEANTYKAGKSVDLSRFSVGEQIGVQVTEEVALAIRTDGTPASDSTAVSLAAAEAGGAGAVLEGEAVEVAAKVTAIDPQARKVSFQFADGTTKAMKAHKKIDLSGLKVGDTVVVQYAEALVIGVTGA
jgi:hypothetical protein